MVPMGLSFLAPHDVSSALLVEGDRPDLLKELINMTGEVCRSEAEQELILRGTPGTWAECEQIARFKTGSLFAFAAVAGGSGNAIEADALREAGFILGTAYQLADDILDASGNEEISGKTLGRDEQEATTAITATAGAPSDPVNYLFTLLKDFELLHPWDHLQAAWDGYIESEFQPIISKFVNA